MIFKWKFPLTNNKIQIKQLQLINKCIQRENFYQLPLCSLRRWLKYNPGDKSDEQRIVDEGVENVSVKIDLRNKQRFNVVLFKRINWV